MAVLKLPCETIVLDGEAVCLREDGRPDFNAMRTRAACHEARLIAFDLLVMDVRDLRRKPERRRAPATLLGQHPQDALRFSPHVEAGDGEALFRHACAINLAGIVSKLRGSLYRSGPCRDWLNVKCEGYERL